MALDPRKMISTERIVTIKSTAKEAALEELIDVLASSSMVGDKVELRSKILERERTLSTGVGCGMAIPHVKIPTIKDFVAAIGLCPEGINFESLDGAPTRVIVMIGCNNTQSADFLKVLAKVVMRLKDQGAQRRILEAKTKAEIYELFVAADGVLG